MDVNLETTTNETTTETPDTTSQEPDYKAELDKLKADYAKLQGENAKQKTAIDKATKEAADYKKQLRANQNQDEQEKADAQERIETMERELNELKKNKAIAEISKSVMAFVGDASASDTIAGHLYGADNVDEAIMALSDAWAAKEKQLKAQYSKITAPAGGSSAPSTTKEDVQKMSLMERINWKKEHPDEYKEMFPRD